MDALGTQVLEVAAPLAGQVRTLSEVPDPVFSGLIMGPGAALMPVATGAPTHSPADSGLPEQVQALAPICGRIAKLHPHAFIIAADGAEGEPQRAVLVHLGLDTVQLAGQGFTLLVQEGQHVRTGDPVVTWSPADVARRGLSPVVPVIALQAAAAQVSLLPTPGAVVETGQALLAWS